MSHIKIAIACFGLSFLSVLAFAPLLQAGQAGIDEVVVSATGIPTPITHLGVSVDVITAEELHDQQIVYLQDALKTSAGVSVYQNGGAGTLSSVFLRGVSGKYIGLQIDGIDMFDPVGDQPLWSDINVAGVSRIEIIRGSNSILYGGSAIGGVVSVFTDIGGERRSWVKIEAGDFGTNSIHFGSKGAFGDKVAYGATLMRLNTDGISAADANNGNSEADFYKNSTLNGRMAVRLTDRLNLALSAYGANGENAYDDFVPKDAYGTKRVFERQSGRIGFVYDQDHASYDAAHEFALTYYANDGEEFSDYVRISASKSKREEANYSAVITADIGKFIVGLDHTTERYNTALAPATEAANMADYAASVNAIYVLAQIDAKARTHMTLAARIDEHEEFGDYPTWRFTVIGRVSDGVSLRSAIGTAFKAASLYQLHDPTYGNAALHPETSTSVDFGIITAAVEGLGFEFSVFEITVKDLIGFDPLSFRATQIGGRVRSRGAEAIVDWQIRPALHLAANYTYTHSLGADNSRDIRRPLHSLNVALRHAPSDRLSLMFSLQSVHTTLDRNFNVFPPKQVKLDDYNLVAIAGRYRFGARVELYARIENALNESYQTVFGYGTFSRAFYVGTRINF